MKVTLTISEGSRRAVVVDSPEFLIGRAADCDPRLRNPWISRHHCLLTIQDGQVFVRDLRSLQTFEERRTTSSPAPRSAALR
jgi:pSer/pThr/pTyr-binding forkhead associated (FHA) protein